MPPSFHAPRHTYPYGRARRPRRAAPMKTPSETPQVCGPPGRRPLPRPHAHLTPYAHPGRARRPRRAAPTKTPSETPTGARAAGTSAPTTQHTTFTHALCHAHPGRAQRPRRAAPMKTPSETPTGARAAGTSAPTTPPRTPHAMRAVGRARRPRRAAPTKMPSETPTGARAAGDVGPYHAPRNIHTRHTHTLVGRDVHGAPRPRERPRRRHDAARANFNVIVPGWTPSPSRCPVPAHPYTGGGRGC